MDKDLNFKKNTNLKFLFFKYTFKWEDIKKQSEVLVNKLGCPRSFVGGMLHAIASDFSDIKTWE